MTYLLAVLIGVIVGWAIPQPTWARSIQDKITVWVNSKAGG